MAEGRAMSGSREVCPFYSYSSCRNGDRCEFIHGATCNELGNNVCKFFLMGTCRYGARCWFNHTMIIENSKSVSDDDEQATGLSQTEIQNFNNDSTVQSLDMELCPHFFDGVCPYDACQCKHGEFCSTCSKFCLDPFDENQRSLHLEACRQEQRVENLPVLNHFNENQQSRHHESRGQRERIGSQPVLNPFDENQRPGHHETRGQSQRIRSQPVLNPLDENQRRLHLETRGQDQRTNNPPNLNLLNDNLRNLHLKACGQEQRIESELDLDKTCGICFDVIKEKERISERQFGILEKCNHVFCLSCIKQWRRAHNTGNWGDSIDPTITRACPECRVLSEHYIPSLKWVDSKEDKEKLIHDFKMSLGTKHCKFFNRGRGECLLNETCPYLHALLDGTEVNQISDRNLNFYQRIRRCLVEYSELFPARDRLMIYLNEMEMNNHEDPRRGGVRR